MNLEQALKVFREEKSMSVEDVEALETILIELRNSYELNLKLNNVIDNICNECALSDMCIGKRDIKCPSVDISCKDCLKAYYMRGIYDNTRRKK